MRMWIYFLSYHLQFLWVLSMHHPYRDSIRSSWQRVGFGYFDFLLCNFHSIHIRSQLDCDGLGVRVRHLSLISLLTLTSFLSNGSLAPRPPPPLIPPLLGSVNPPLTGLSLGSSPSIWTNRMRRRLGLLYQIQLHEFLNYPLGSCNLSPGGLGIRAFALRIE